MKNFKKVQFLTICIAVVPCMMLANIDVQDEKNQSYQTRKCCNSCSTNCSCSTTSCNSCGKCSSSCCCTKSLEDGVADQSTEKTA